MVRGSVAGLWCDLNCEKNGSGGKSKPGFQWLYTPAGFHWHDRHGRMKTILHYPLLKIPSFLESLFETHGFPWQIPPFKVKGRHDTALVFCRFRGMHMAHGRHKNVSGSAARSWRSTRMGTRAVFFCFCWFEGRD